MSLTENSLSWRYLHLKIIPKGVLRYAEIPRDINYCKNADFKILSFLTKNAGLTP